MAIALTQEKSLTLQTSCITLLNTTSPTITEVAEVLGKIVSSLQGVVYGALYYRHLGQDKTRALRNNRWTLTGACFYQQMPN